MNKDFKEIAKKLGIAIPACLFSIGIVNAETVKENNYLNKDNVKVCEIGKSNIVNNEVVKFLSADFTKSTKRMTPDHTDTHTDMGGNHTDSHSNISHINNHSNQNAYQRNNQCYPHSDSHTNRDGYNRHTNSGNERHTDYHTDRNYKPNC